MNEKNLKSNSERTPSERKELARKGGIASGKARREKKQWKDIIETLLELPLKKGITADIGEMQSLSETRGKNLTVGEAMLIRTVNKALKGDIKAQEFLQGIVEPKQRPFDGMEDSVINITIKPRRKKP